jgi:hypothetical protein
VPRHSRSLRWVGHENTGARGLIPSLRNKSYGTGIIAAHPCKKRKDGAPSVEMPHIQMVKGGPAAPPFSMARREGVCSVDYFGALCLAAFDAVLHVLQLLGRVSLPFRHLSHDTQRIAGAVGEGWISRELLVCQVGVIDHWSGRLDDVDPLRPIASGQFSAPDSGIKRTRAVHPGQRLAFAEVGPVSRHDQVPVRQIGTGSVEKLLAKLAINCRHQCGAPPIDSGTTRTIMRSAKGLWQAPGRLLS